MRCYECGGKYVRERGPLKMVDEDIGPYIVDSVDYLKCDQCGDLLFSPETSLAIEKRREEIMDEILQSKPLSAFLSAVEAASALGISRQALHKHRRIRRGFIFQTQFEGKTVYLKRSVELFKTTGDGRFLLRQPESDIKYTYKMVELQSWFPYDTSKKSPVQLGGRLFGSLHQTQSKGDMCYVR